MPKVSVIIPTYNRAHLLGRAIQSVLNQTYQDFEIIVVDDASVDETEELVKSFADGRINYIRHQKNKGGSAARNTGIKASHGEYIAFLDSDDEWLRAKLRKQIKCLEGSNEEVGVVYCAYYSQDDESGFIKKSNTGIRRGDVYESLLRGWCPASTSFFLVRRQLLIRAGLFDPSLSSFQDYDLWLRLAQICHFEAVEAPLAIKHSHTGFQIARDPSIRFKALNLFIAKWEPLIKKEVGNEVARQIRLKHLSQVYANAVLANIEQGKRGEAVNSFFKYIRISREVNPKKAVSLLIALIGGASTYKFVKRNWRQWKRSEVLHHYARRRADGERV